MIKTQLQVTPECGGLNTNTCLRVAKREVRNGVTAVGTPYVHRQQYILSYNTELQFR